MNDNSSKFTWVETYKEIVDYLKDKKNAQKSLINLLKEIGISGFKDQDKDGTEFELSEIDPFTFFCYLNKFGREKRIDYLQKLANKLNLKNIPEDDFGIPSANAQKLHLFPFKIDRNNNEIETLWGLFFKALEDDIDDDLFDRALNIKSVGKTKLSEALFNLNPEKFFPINGPTKPYLKEHFKIAPDFNTFSDYRVILEKLRKKTDKPFYEVSFDAWKWKQNSLEWLVDIIKIHCIPERIQYRQESEKTAKDLLNEKDCNFTREEWESFFKLANSDFWNGKKTSGRFGLSFTGNNKEQMLKDIDKLNKWTKDIWSCDDKSVAEILNAFWKDNVAGAGIGFPTLLLYLKDPNKFNLWLPKMEEGLKKIQKISLPRKNSKSYLKYNSQLISLRDQNKLEPQTLDIIFCLGENDLSINDEQVLDKKITLPLNTIIYGPPGTGKTYRLKNEFFERFTDEQSTQTKEEFCEELIQGISWWQTISVVMLDRKKAKVQEIFDHPLLQAKVRISDNKTPKNTIWSWLQRHTKDDCANVNFKKRDNPQFFNKDNNSTWTIDEEIAKAETPDFYEVLEKYQGFKPQIESKKRYVFTTFHQSFSYEDFIEGIKPKLMKTEEDLESQDISYHIENGIFKNIVNKALNDPDKDYAIFIDEINRGNIANIFGELITLIEEDKRKGRDNYIPAILPYSKTEFGVPENLYIIGTMNTADRSVEALDNALRRRFSFLEMNPEPAKLSQGEFACDGVDLEKLLSAINNRIEKLLDKDYCIGHSYFMNISDQKNPLEELKLIFSNRILPLLQEYFYGDWGKIMLVLGKGFIEKKVESVSFLATKDFDDFEDYDEKPVFSLVSSDTWTLETFKKIYE